MKSPTHPNIRGEQVIRLLVKHGALSFGAIKRLLEPEITEKRLRDVLSRLVKSGIIRRRFVHQNGGSASYYDIAEPQRSDLLLPAIHSFLLTHNDLCALAAECLHRSFPRATFIREHEIPRDPKSRNVMRYLPDTQDSLPDFLVVLPSKTGSTPVYVAVEIERSTKSTKRLIKKLSKYASRTLLDGVIYLSEDTRVLKALSYRFHENVASRSLRIAHYRNHFLLLAGCPTKHHFEISIPQNVLNTPVSLHSWANTLATIPMVKRRDLAFAESGGGSQVAV